jgi:hypothetical protein
MSHENQYNRINQINLVAYIPFDFMYLDSLKKISRISEESIREINRNSKTHLKEILDSITTNKVILDYLRVMNN